MFQVIYFLFCVIILGIGSIFLMKALWKYIKHFDRSNFMVKAFISPLLADFVCILNFLSRDLYHLSNGGKLDYAFISNILTNHFDYLVCKFMKYSKGDYNI